MSAQQKIGSLVTTSYIEPAYAVQRNDTGIFYAYIHSTEDDTYFRMVIIFASRSVADEWWRAISSSTNALLADSVRRITPQLYTHTPTKINICYFFTLSQVRSIADPFRGKMFFSWEHDKGGGRGISIIPSQAITDYLSGNWFYIRSKSPPNWYWFYDPNDTSKAVCASNIQRTLFCVTAPDLAPGTVMIGKDQIILSIGPHLFVHINESGNVVSAGRPTPMKFKALGQGNFIANASGSLTYDEVDGTFMRRDGWELA